MELREEGIRQHVYVKKPQLAEGFTIPCGADS